MYLISPKNVERKLENNEKKSNLNGGVTKLCFTTGIRMWYRFIPSEGGNFHPAFNGEIHFSHRRKAEREKKAARTEICF